MKARTALEGAGLAVWRGDRCLFEGLEFGLGQGQLALVTGPNGSGKTTLLRILAGLALPSEGRVTWEGRDVYRLPPEQRGDVAYRGHLDALKRELTVAENLAVYQSLWSAQADVAGALAEVNLDWAAALKVRYLSAGQRRRLGLATLKLCAAKLWILDEPATNLDTNGRALVAEWIQTHIAAGGLAVVATHQPEQLSRPGTIMIEL